MLSCFHFLRKFFLRFRKIICNFADVNNEALIAETRKKVNAMMENRPLFAW